MAQEGKGRVARIEILADGPRLFERLFNEGDVDGFVSLYEPDAVLLHEAGQPAAGTAAIRAAVAELMGGSPHFTITRRSALKSGNLVLASYSWTLANDGPDGEAVNQAGTGAIVFRQQPDGAWLAVLDNMLACP